MAVDYFHRLLITGPCEDVTLLRRQLVRRTTASVAGQLWRETVPFSLARLCELVPMAGRIDPHGTSDPFDISVWPVQKAPRGLAEMRYQLHTRNVELLPYVRLLSTKFPALTFYLVTFCWDDGKIAAYRVCSGHLRKWILPDARQEVHWDRARQEFDVTGDNVYEDDSARDFAEEAALEEALDHWMPDLAGPRRPREWWNRPVANDFDTARWLMVAALAEASSHKEGETSSTRAKRSSGGSGRQASRRKP